MVNLRRRSKSQTVEDVREELIRRKGSWIALQKKSKGQLTYRWILAFAQRQIIEPPYSKLERLGKLVGIEIGRIDLALQRNGVV